MQRLIGLHRAGTVLVNKRILNRSIRHRLHRVRINTSTDHNNSTHLRRGIARSNPHRLIQTRTRHTRVKHNVSRRLVSQVSVSILKHNVSRMRTMRPTTRLRVVHRSQLNSRRQHLRSQKVFGVLEVAKFAKRPSTEDRRHPLNIRQYRTLPGLRRAYTSKGTVHLRQEERNRTSNLIHALLVHRRRVHTRQIRAAIITLRKDMGELRICNGVRVLTPGRHRRPPFTLSFRDAVVVERVFSDVSPPVEPVYRAPRHKYDHQLML